MKVYIGLDTALVTGIALWYPTENLALVTDIKGNPLEQFHWIYHLIPSGELCLVLEKMVHFRNAKTTRSLLERYGFLKYSFLDRDFRVEEVHPGLARKFIGAKSKEDVKRYFWNREIACGVQPLSEHQADALTVALYQSHLEGCEIYYPELTLRKMKER